MTQQRPVSELLPWLFLNDQANTVINKDSSLMAVYAVKGIDEESSDDSGLEIAGEIHDAALRYVAQLPVRIWHRIDRVPVKAYQYGFFTNKTAEEIDKFWGAGFAAGKDNYSNTTTISIALSTATNKRALMDLARDRVDLGESPLPALLKAVVDRYKKGDAEVLGFTTEEDLTGALHRMEQNVLQPMEQKMHHLQMQRLTGDDLCGYLKSTTSTGVPGAVAHNPLVYLDAALSDTWIDNRHRDYLVLEGPVRRYAAVLSLKTAPQANCLGRLNKLLSLPFALTISSCWKAESPQVSIKELKAARTFDELSRMDIKSLVRSMMKRQETLIDDDNEPVTDVGVKAVEYIDQIQEAKLNFGYLTCSIIVYADDETTLKHNVEAVQNALTTSKLVFLREREGALSSYAAGIPGNVKDPVRWFHVEAGNVTDLAPLVTLDQGSSTHPIFKDKDKQPRQALAVLRTKDNTSYYMNNHVGELGHSLIVGPSRNGKTMFQMFLESQFLKYPNATVINFDKDYSCEAATLMHGGELFDLTPGSTTGLRMNPLAYLKAPGGVTWCAGWVDRLMALRGPRLSDTQLTELTERLKSLKDLPNVRLNSLRGQLVGDMQERLAYWCEGGVYGEFFDNPDDELHFSTMTTFELGGLIERKENDVLRAFTDYVFFRIADRFRSATDHGEGEVGATNIYFEEAGFLLEDPLFEDRAVNYLMTLAKMNAFLTMTAQSPEAFMRSERLKAAVRDNVATVIFLPNPKATRGELPRFYQEVFGVNRHHLQLIAKAIRKREYCIWQAQENHFRVAVAAFPPEIVARLRSDKHTRKILNETYSPVDPTWRDRYISAVMGL